MPTLISLSSSYRDQPDRFTLLSLKLEVNGGKGKCEMRNAKFRNSHFFVPCGEA